MLEKCKSVKRKSPQKRGHPTDNIKMNADTYCGYKKY